MKRLPLLFIPFLLSATELPYYNDASFTPEWIAPNSPQFEELHTIPPFQFKNQFDQPLSQSDLQGKIYVANFFFTTCPGICKKMTRNLKIVYQEFSDDDSFAILSHSVTPEYDTPEKLHSYAEKYDILSPNWQFLTGDKEEIYTIARQSYFADEEIDLTQDSDTFLHSEKLILVDQDSHIRGVYNGVMTVDMKRLIQDIHTLKANERAPHTPPQ